jgi:hypothetical protein
MWIECSTVGIINLDKVQRLFIRPPRVGDKYLNDKYLVMCYLDSDGEFNWERDTGPNGYVLFTGSKEECKQYLERLKSELKVQEIGGE